MEFGKGESDPEGNTSPQAKGLACFVAVLAVIDETCGFEENSEALCVV